MCLIAYAPNGYIPRDHLANAIDENPNGWGVWAGGHVERGLGKRKFWYAWKNRIPGPVVIHFRFATHGEKTIENCHPYDLASGGLLFHNGVLPLDGGKRSDTYVLSQIMGTTPVKSLLPLLEMAIGTSKLLIVERALDPDSPIHLVNEKAGEWYGKVWYSSDSWEDPAYTYANWRESVIADIPPVPSGFPSNVYVPAKYRLQSMLAAGRKQ